MYPLTLLTEELKSDEVETRIKAMRRLRTVAQALGPERTRSDLLPFLRGKPVCGTHHSLFFTRYSVTNDRKHVGLTAAEATEDEDEVVVALAEELGGFVDLVGGAEHASILVEPFEVLAGVEETVVRDRAVDSLQKVVAVVPNVDDVMVPLAKRLAEGDWSHRAFPCVRSLHRSTASWPTLDAKRSCASTWSTCLCVFWRSTTLQAKWWYVISQLLSDDGQRRHANGSSCCCCQHW